MANNPLSRIHPMARILAASALCAHQQGKFWPMHDVLYTRDVSSEAELEPVIESIGLDSEKFMACSRNDSPLQDVVDEHQQIAKRLGLVSTPSFVLGRMGADGKFVALKVIRGAQPVEVFRDLIAAMS
jgi:protein-disulfide isomerase